MLQISTKWHKISIEMFIKFDLNDSIFDRNIVILRKYSGVWPRCLRLLPKSSRFRPMCLIFRPKISRFCQSRGQLNSATWPRRRFFCRKFNKKLRFSDKNKSENEKKAYLRQNSLTVLKFEIFDFTIKMLNFIFARHDSYPNLPNG